MADLALQERHVAAVLDGRKPFTLRRAWRNGRTPGIGTPIRFVVKPRSPERLIVASAVVQFRASIIFDEQGITSFDCFRASSIAPAAAGVRTLLRACVGGQERHGGRACDVFARLDGFETWGEFWRFHTLHRKPGSLPEVARELIGFGAVSEDFAHG